MLPGPRALPLSSLVWVQAPALIMSFSLVHSFLADTILRHEVSLSQLPGLQTVPKSSARRLNVSDLSSGCLAFGVDLGRDQQNVADFVVHSRGQLCHLAGHQTKYQALYERTTQDTAIPTMLTRLLLLLLLPHCRSITCTAVLGIVGPILESLVLTNTSQIGFQLESMITLAGANVGMTVGSPGTGRVATALGLADKKRANFRMEAPCRKNSSNSWTIKSARNKFGKQSLQMCAVDCRCCLLINRWMAASTQHLGQHKVANRIMFPACAF